MPTLNLMMPGFPKYQPRDLVEHFGYDNLFRTVGSVEIATLQTLGEIEIMPAGESLFLTTELIDQIMAIPTTDVVRVEREITKHDVRAWVLLAKRLMPSPLQKWTHVPLTSYDPVDTGRVIQFLNAYQQVVNPKLRKVFRILIDLIKRYAHTLQIGRTHGQHALPITVGFWLATILHRMLFNTKMMDQMSGLLVGKISGAVGAYNAQHGLKFIAQCGDTSFEERVLAKLGLKPSPISTQILPPEPMAYFLFSCAMTSASFGQLGRDCRHLMRSEIGEIGEPFEEEQAGSSTMAQKRNPVNFENTEGMWIDTKNEFGKVLDTLISEHQRDLVASPVARKFPTILINLVCQLETMLRENKEGMPFLSRLTVNEAALRRNFEMSAHLVLAEPLYIALQMAGYPGDAHDLINKKVVPVSQKTGRMLIDVVSEMADQNGDIRDALDHIPEDIQELLHHPENYTGLAGEKAMKIVEAGEKYLTE